MVSKIAVMALVAVVAVPILLGYGMNITTEDRMVWTENNDPINVKDYLQTTFDATGATFVDADIYQMNSNIFWRHSMGAGYPGPNTDSAKFYPSYQSYTAKKTSIPLYSNLYSTDFYLDGPYYGQIISVGDYDPNNYYNLKTYGLNGVHLIDYSGIKEVIYDGDGLHVHTYNGYLYYATGITRIFAQAVGTPSAIVTFDPGGNNRYADIAAGYRLNLDGAVWSDTSNFSRPSDVEWTRASISNTTKSVTITMDLNTITEPNATFHISTNQGRLHLQKTTTDGVVKWEYATLVNGTYYPVLYPLQELYYNNLASSNTYQVQLTTDYKATFNYIGGWPDTLGIAEPLITYTTDIWYNTYFPVEYINGLYIEGQTPVMRFDHARVGAYDYRVMEDAVYEPAKFKTNPATTLTNGLRYGTSIEFGGNTYTVNKGNITIGTHEFSLEGMTFDSVLVGGMYENRIDGNTVSVTAEPSTITFNGKWLTDVTTRSQSTTTVSETKWESGEFAWDGIDTNFKMAGILASLGAFVALAIYGRRSGAKVLPLLLVCGGAAFVFLLMI